MYSSSNNSAMFQIGNDMIQQCPRFGCQNVDGIIEKQVSPAHLKNKFSFLSLVTFLFRYFILVTNHFMSSLPVIFCSVKQNVGYFLGLVYIVLQIHCVLE